MGERKLGKHLLVVPILASLLPHSDSVALSLTVDVESQGLCYTMASSFKWHNSRLFFWCLSKTVDASPWQYTVVTIIIMTTSLLLSSLQSVEIHNERHSEYIESVNYNSVTFSIYTRINLKFIRHF